MPAGYPREERADVVGAAGAHGVAHVLEMQGRRDEGIAWLAGLEPNWEGGNNLKHHLW